MKLQRDSFFNASFFSFGLSMNSFRNAPSCLSTQRWEQQTKEMQPLPLEVCEQEARWVRRSRQKNASSASMPAPSKAIELGEEAVSKLAVRSSPSPPCRLRPGATSADAKKRACVCFSGPACVRACVQKQGGREREGARPQMRKKKHTEREVLLFRLFDDDD